MRQAGGFSVARLTRQDLRLWEEDEGISLDPWERNALIQIDAAFVAHKAAQASAQGSGR